MSLPINESQLGISTKAVQKILTYVKSNALAIEDKTDKISGGTSGDLVSLDNEGNITDSGYSVDSFATASQGAKADSALQPTDVTSDYSATGTAPVNGTAVASAVSGKADKVSGATNNNFASLDANGNLKDSGHKHSDYATAAQGSKADSALQPEDVKSTYSATGTDPVNGTAVASAISNKADKVSSATNNNFAALDSNGNLKDSGHKHSDYATASQGAKADSAMQSIGSVSDTSAFAGTESLAVSASGSDITFKSVANLWTYLKTSKLSESTTDIGGNAATASDAKSGSTLATTLSGKEISSNKKQSIDDTSTSDYPSSKAVADFVNSSIATNTANYISDNGQPFTSVDALNAYTGTVTNNDYAFVTGTDSDGNTYYDRYKASVSGSTVSWAKEYRLNNSSFTAAEWSAISSGITSTLVSSYNSHIADTDIHVTATNKSEWNAKYDKPSGGIPKTDLASAVQTSLGKADTALQSSDITSTYSSTGTSAVNGTAVASAISTKADKVTNATNGNFASLDANGNLADSGHKHSDYATASQGAKADTALQPEDVTSTYSSTGTDPVNGTAVASAISSATETDSVPTKNSAKLLSSGTIYNQLQVVAQSLNSLNDTIADVVNRENYGDMMADSITLMESPKIGDAPMLIVGTTAPSITPAFAGQIYINTSNNAVYIASNKDNTTYWRNIVYTSSNASSGGSTLSLVTTGEKYTWNNKYAKPSGGIPKTDLASAVQTSLGKADSALQSSNVTSTYSSTGTDPVNGAAIADAISKETDELPTKNSSKLLSSGTLYEQLQVLVQSVNELNDNIESFLEIENYGELRADSISLMEAPKIGDDNMIITGSGAPSVTPAFAGQVYIDTTNNGIYIASNKDNSTYWRYITYTNSVAASGGSTLSLVTTGDKYNWNNKYAKPSGGIPSTDLASAVQTSLGKADTAVQPSDLEDWTPTEIANIFANA